MGKMDAAYRRLFQHKTLLRDLLACVLSPGLFASLDWECMRPVPTHHVSDELQQRHGDCAWLIPRKDTPAPDQAPPQGLCILLLLEQQSKPDDTMPLRLVCYAGLNYQTLLNSRDIGLPLPPVLPVVLYSGRRPWRTAQDFAGLQGDIPDDLRPYQLQMRYLLIHEQDLMKRAGLPGRNLAMLLFRLNRNGDIERWPDLLHTLIQVVREQPDHAELNRSLTIWLQYMVQRNAPPAEVLPPVNTLQELEMMIAEKPGLWARQWLREGRKEGRQEGVAEGQADLLLGQIQRKFGPVADAVSRQVLTARSSELKAWSLNILDAASLDDVFRG